MRAIPPERFHVDECNPYGMDKRGSVHCELDKPSIFPALNPVLVESGTNNGFYWEGTTSIITTRYDVSTYPSASQLLYRFVVTGATIVSGGSGHDWVEVETKSNTTDTFNIQLFVTNATETDSISTDFTHTRVEKLYPIKILSINEDIEGSCVWSTTTKCIATSIYSATYEYAHDGPAYEWTCSLSEGFTDNGDGTCTVVTNSDENVYFTIGLVLSDSDSFHYIQEDFYHYRVENYIEAVILTDIVEDTSGTCGYYPGENCTTQSIYTVEHEWGTIFTWTATGATIIEGQSTNTVTIKTVSNADVSFDLKCLVQNAISAEYRIENFTHTRIELADPLVLTSIVESVTGSCSYIVGEDCTASSTYDMVASDYDTIVWSVVGDGATIASGQGTLQATVETTGDIQTNFTVTGTVTGNYGAEDSIDVISSHARAKTEDPVNIVSLTESVTGACEWTNPDTCIATSTYDVVATDYDTLVWVVTGATLASGQGTTQITVTSDDDIDTSFTVEITANGSLGGSDVESAGFTHTRTELFDPVFDQELLYDGSNIATEFI